MIAFDATGGTLENLTINQNSSAVKVIRRIATFGSGSSGYEVSKVISEKEVVMNVYWENKENGSNKFWAARIFSEFNGKTNVYILVRKWGKIGTSGQMFRTTFTKRSQAEAELIKLVREKESKGYKGIF